MSLVVNVDCIHKVNVNYLLILFKTLNSLMLVMLGVGFISELLSWGVK